ncbi:hypothetical protein [Flavobacterium branchiophilum]|uniref:hypothetical protein n=1 Tax=Flavobacterium branchiophilum TaxID=55197 RepID=UPI0011D21235|nr:hypothetical protein [Flavobacterium branchiophilum]
MQRKTYNTQNYNCYGYCVNNPLKYTDITGNVFGIDDIIIGAISSIATSLNQGVGYENAGWHGLGSCGATNKTGMIIFGTVMGAAGASLTGGNFYLIDNCFQRFSMNLRFGRVP